MDDVRLTTDYRLLTTEEAKTDLSVRPLKAVRRVCTKVESYKVESYKVKYMRSIISLEA